MDQGSGKKSAGGGGALSGTEFAGVGLQFALTIFVFSFAGVWLDRRLHTSPWFLIICVFAGAAGGFFSMFRKITAAQRRDAERVTRAKLEQQAQHAEHAQHAEQTKQTKQTKQQPGDRNRGG